MKTSAQPSRTPVHDHVVSAAAWEHVLGSVTVHPPDAFYRPPTQVPDKPGALLRSEQLKDVTLPAGMQGWRILYTTRVNDSTPRPPSQPYSRQPQCRPARGR